MNQCLNRSLKCGNPLMANACDASAMGTVVARHLPPDCQSLVCDTGIDQSWSIGEE